MEAVAQVTQHDKDEAVRKVLFDTFCNQYHSLANFIQKLPINHEMKGKICLFMDTAFLWTKESFTLLELEANRAKLAPVPAPEAPVAQESAAVADVAETA